jgi:hypothetical protein
MKRRLGLSDSQYDPRAANRTGSFQSNKSERILCSAPAAAILLASIRSLFFFAAAMARRIKGSAIFNAAACEIR